MNNYLTPYVLEKGSMNMHTFDIFSKLLQHRIIFVGDEIDDNLANLVIAQLLYLDSLEHSPITMYINSPGGEVTAGLGIYDTMNHIKSPVYTLCVGIAASMGAILLLAGENGHRKSLPNSSILIHQASGGTGYAKCSDVKIVANELERISKLLANIIAEKTGQPLEKVIKDYDRDFWMTAPEAKEYGIIDEIL